MLQICLLAVLLDASAFTDRLLQPSRVKDIIALRTEHTQLENQKNEIDQQVQQLQRKYQDRLAYDQVLFQLSQLKENDPELARLRAKKGYYETFTDAAKDTNKADILATNIEQLQKNAKDALQRLAANERQIAELLMVEKDRQSFMTLVSAIFAGLIFILIAGFFWIVKRDQERGPSVFNDGPSGLQMLTLLSVVIAIVLFGIIGVLEGKELSALLGGLIGYILGRVADQKKSGQPAGGAPHGSS